MLPKFLADIEPPEPSLGELVLVETMHERKAEIATRSDAFLVLPGGLGTLEEAAEIMTLRQVSMHTKNIVFLNVGGYWDPLATMLASMEDRGFFILNGRRTFQCADDLQAAWALLGFSS